MTKNWFDSIKESVRIIDNSKKEKEEGEVKVSVDPFHKKEKEELLSLLSQVGDSLSEQEEKVLDVFLKTEGHVCAKDLREKIDGGRELTVEDVEDALNKFCRYGIAQKVRFNDGPLFFEHLHLGQGHDHLICVKCGKIEEFFDPRLEALQRELSQERGFQPLAHRLVIQGLCSRCRQVRQTVMPLAMCAPGEKVTIARLVGGRCICSKLSAMGLNIGQEVEILNNSGPFIIKAKGTRLALGRGLAQKVLVSPRIEKGNN